VRSTNDAGSADAGRLYEQFGPALHRYALMILANRQDSEDVIQQVFLTLVRRGAVRLDSPEAYLRTAVRNECFSVLRRRRDTPVDASATLIEPVSPGDDHPEERLALEAALRDLPPDQREVVHLRTFEGLTFQEIADVTSESINTIASRYRYAMTKLRAVLDGGTND
jgi:RNA polymerase sigma-70 factor (ECF subfamily)